jgi:hypothetical protein
MKKELLFGIGMEALMDRTVASSSFEFLSDIGIESLWTVDMQDQTANPPRRQPCHLFFNRQPQTR